MAYEQHFAKVSRVAGADLSAYQYQAVKLDAAGAVVPVAATTDVPFGVLQNAPKQGQEAEIVVAGITKIKASAALAIGNVLSVSADGRAAAVTIGTDTTRYVLGTLLTTAGGANEIASALINTSAPNRAA